ncbi:hypothetical protein ERO13_D05G300500v2 [Gossypium hirsutum]|uniref:WAT1-related protein n=1 Tax=Gossypium hirsutum TaxID=3635 RepID=A0ABM3A778_GOSHI|nr:WAT1-related protein At2g39510-like isoform X2 [Gossypium hirsutum]KAG4148687.1 hypothetical protein ERO13_D05G300500v2 [Gossypium hirsutum]
MGSLGAILDQSKPFLAVLFLQFGISGMSIITKFALNQGMSQHVLVVYRHAIATLVIAPFAIVLERKIRPKMSLSVFVKILLLALLEPTMDQNLLYTGMKYTTATFTSAMTNVLPAFVFLLAWIVNASAVKQDPIKGALMIIFGCFCWAGFIILQAITLKSYPAELSLTAFICLAGTIGGSIVALAMEAGNAAVWSIHFDVKLLAAVYSGVICSGITYYVQGVIMRSRGPVFVTAFNPLSMVIVAILSSFILSEILYLGRIIGAIVIVIGLYMVLWGKSKDQCSSNQNIKVEEASNDLKMIVIDDHQTSIISDQDFVVVLDLTCNKVSPTKESV